MAKTLYGANGERQLQWYSSATATAFAGFLGVRRRSTVLPLGGHDCDEHQRAVRTERYKRIRIDTYAELPLCTAADIGASPSFLALRALASRGGSPRRKRSCSRHLRARLELYDLAADPWELQNLADDPAYAKQVRELAAGGAEVTRAVRRRQRLPSPH